MFGGVPNTLDRIHSLLANKALSRAPALHAWAKYLCFTCIYTCFEASCQPFLPPGNGGLIDLDRLSSDIRIVFEIIPASMTDKPEKALGVYLTLTLREFAGL